MSTAFCSRCHEPIDGSNAHCVCGHVNPFPSWDEGGHSPVGTDETGEFDIARYSPRTQRRRRLPNPAREPTTAVAGNEDETTAPHDVPTISVNTDVHPVPSTPTLANASTFPNVSEDVNTTLPITTSPNEMPDLDEPAPNLDGQGDLDRAGTLFQVFIQQLPTFLDVGQLFRRGITRIGQLLWPLSVIAGRIRNVFGKRGENAAPDS